MYAWWRNPSGVLIIYSMNFSSFSNFEVKCPVPPIIFGLSKAYIGKRTEKKAVYPVAQWIPSWVILEYAENIYRETVQFILKFLSMVYKECLIAEQHWAHSIGILPFLNIKEINKDHYLTRHHFCYLQQALKFPKSQKSRLEQLSQHVNWENLLETRSTKEA